MITLPQAILSEARVIERMRERCYVKRAGPLPCPDNGVDFQSLLVAPCPFYSFKLRTSNFFQPSIMAPCTVDVPSSSISR